MSCYRILIVEDDPLVALDLEEIVSRLVRSDVTISATIADATAALGRHVDFALLDVDVLDGKTYDFASNLTHRDIPFAFVSASDRAHMPEPLRTAPFVAKPFTVRQIEVLLLEAGHDPSVGHA